MTFANTGPGTKRMSRRPDARSSSMTSVPMMSDGIRSGVNWMRLNFKWTACASVLMSSVFANPGTPRNRQCPPATKTVRISWTTVSWPMMARPSSSRRRDARRCASSNESIGAKLYQLARSTAGRRKIRRNSWCSTSGSRNCFFASCNTSSGLLLRKLPLLDSRDDDVARIDHLGEMDSRDFGQQLVGIQLRQAVVGVDPTDQLGERDPKRIVERPVRTHGHD